MQNQQLQKQQKIIPWQESRWLVLSSLSIFPQAYISLCRHHYNQSLLVLLTLFLSINYWREPKMGIRRNLDLLFSKLLCLYYFYQGVKNIRSGIGLVCYPNALLIMYSYHSSNNLYYAYRSYWLYWHIAFHLLCGIQGYIIIHYLP
jgi:hypothetical protein